MENRELLKRAFSEKLTQLRGVLDKPLVLLFIRAPNPNMKMFLLDAHLTRPSAIIFRPDKEPVVLVGSIEHASLEPISEMCELRITEGGLDEVTDEIRGLVKGEEVYVEYCPGIPALDRLLHSIHQNISEFAHPVSGKNIIGELRIYKTKSEVDFIERACSTTVEILDEVGEFIRPGMWRDEILSFILKEIAERGHRPSFEPIVAYGDEASEPHPIPVASRPLNEGDLLIVDMGVWHYGYASDLTRTYLVGGDVREHPFYEKWFQLENYLRRKNLKGVLPKEVCKGLNKLSEELDVLKYQKHSYSHGLGVEVHDVYPYVSAKSVAFDDLPFDDNMIFTFEPGFYGEFGGFRFEFDYCIREGRAINLCE